MEHKKIVSYLPKLIRLSSNVIHSQIMDMEKDYLDAAFAVFERRLNNLKA